MARSSRQEATADGQRGGSDLALRSRDLSGFRSRGNSPLIYARNLLELGELIRSIGAPCWAYGVTSAALARFDGFVLEPPFHLVVRRGRSVSRVGHVIHRSRDISRLDIGEVDGIPTMSATRTIIDLAASESRERLAIAIDSALRDRLTSENFLHKRIVELRTHGRAGIGQLVSVLAREAVIRGGHSWLERRFLVLLAQWGFPKPLTQVVVGKRAAQLIRVDCRFPDTNV